MIIDKTNGKLAEVKASEQAKAITGYSSLASRLEYLDGYAAHRDTRCVLYADFAPLSFSFVMEVKKDGEYRRWFNGGLIYHGPLDGFGSGAGPTFAVTLDPTHGWSIHT